MPPSRPSAAPRPAGGLLNITEGDEHTQGDETHVRDRRVGDQLLHVCLHQRHEPDVHNGDQGQGDDQPVQGCCRIGRDGQAEAHETVAADLQHDGRQDHGTAGGRLHVRIRQPGMHRPHGNLDGEGRQEGRGKIQVCSVRHAQGTWCQYLKSTSCRRDSRYR